MSTSNQGGYGSLISPNQYISELKNADTDRKIEIFRDRVDGWQLLVAERCAEHDKHSGFAVLSMVLSYFEMIEAYLKGGPGSSSKTDFIDGCRNVFPDLERDLTAKGYSQDDIEKLWKSLYSKGRCGMYHAAMSRNGILIDWSSIHTVSVDKDQNWVINPSRLVGAIRKHLQRYVEQLSHNSNLRKNFEDWFDKDECWEAAWVVTSQQPSSSSGSAAKPSGVGNP